MSFKSGFVAIMGRPNAGKSTLLNAILQTKVSIVSPKPQTTRNNIIGIYNDADSQIVFTDTPGINTANNKLDEFMQKSVKSAKAGVDVVLLCVDGGKGIKPKDFDFISSFKGTQNLMLIITKTDLTNYEKLYPQLAELNKLDYVKSIIPVSSFKGRNIDVVVNEIKKYLTDNVKYFSEDEYTDKSVRFMISELVREKTLWLLQDEIPHGIAVEVVNYDENNAKINIDADIICEKESHKQIIIGKNGSMIKEIGTKARIDIEKLVDKKVFLNLFVKVKAGWRNKQTVIADLGYNTKDLDK
ncbi:MAG: GTPase Era [Clostridia bacterium]|nr:GTPase Era [Clostridia bacterium]